MIPALLLWIGVALLMLVGLAGTIVPGIPGITLVFAGILLYGGVNGFASVSATFVTIAGIVALLGVAADYAGSVWGSRVGGGRWKAALGAVLGVIIGGLTLGPIGIFVGAFLGAAAGALLEGQRGESVLKVAGASVVGVLGSAVVQFLLALALIVAFIVAVLM